MRLVFTYSVLESGVAAIYIFSAVLAEAVSWPDDAVAPDLSNT